MHLGQLKNKEVYALVVGWFLVGAAFVYGAHTHFLLFHGLAELLSIGIGIACFTIAYNSSLREGSFVGTLGIGLLFVAFVDMLHTLAYKGMGVFPAASANLPTQLWLAGRFLFVLSVFFAINFMGRHVRRAWVLGANTLLCGILLALINLGVFPDAYREGIGLTLFKVGSEYAVCGLLAVAIIMINNRRSAFSAKVFWCVQGAILSTILSEMAFTMYVGVYDISNIVGHYFKCIAFYLIYKAIIETSVTSPLQSVYKEVLDTRSELEQRVRTLGLELDMIFTHARVGLMLLSKGRIIRECNEHLFRMLGYDSPEDLVGKSTRIVHLSEEHFQRFGREYYDALSERDVLHVEYSLRKKDGTPLWCSLSATALDSSRPADLDKGVLWVIDDISERMKTEETLRMALEKLSFHVSNSPLGVIEWDDQARIVKWTSQAEVIFGWKEEEVLNKYWNELSIVHPEDEAYVQDRIGRLFSGADEFNVSENRNLRKDGSVIYCQWYNSPLRDPDGRVVSILSQIADVTELRMALQLAKEASISKSAFLANMSHEIRTPLNGVIGMLQLMQDAKLDAEQREFIDAALQSSKRLTRLLSDILDLSRVEAGKLSLSEEGFVFHDAMEAIRQLFHLCAEEKGIAFAVSVDPAIPEYVRGDAARLQQVLSNLVGNAIKFTDKGRVELSAQLLPSSGSRVCRVLFSVADTGIGIEDEMLAKLFAPFTQVEGSFQRQFQGAGLGLSISKRLVELMGGTIAVESEQGVGSVFHVCIPFKLGELSSAFSAPENHVGRSGMFRVLLVEDDRISRLFSEKFLEKLGHEVVAVGDGQQAVDCLKGSEFDLVLMDAQMPVLDGVAATRAIRAGAAGERNRDIPIVAMTAYAMDGDKKRFLEAGMDRYISKPVDLDQLEAILMDFSQTGSGD